MCSTSLGQHGLAALLDHHFVEARIARVGHAAAVAEAADDAVLDPCRDRDLLHACPALLPASRRGSAPRRARRQAVAAVGGIVLDDARRDHGAEPLAHVALVEAGGERDPRSRPASPPWRRTGRCGGRSSSSGIRAPAFSAPTRRSSNAPSFASSSAADATMAYPPADRSLLHPMRRHIEWRPQA